MCYACIKLKKIIPTYKLHISINQLEAPYLHKFWLMSLFILKLPFPGWIPDPNTTAMDPMLLFSH